MMNPSRSSRHDLGFTLVELLVVISIVSVLLALMIPSINIARAHARQTVCASNLRQQGIAVSGYCMDERDGAFPWHGRFYATWMIMMAPYMGWSGNVTVSGDATLDNQLDRRNKRSNSVDARIKAYQCPERSFRALETVVAEYHYDYGMNYTLRCGRPDQINNAGNWRQYWAARRTLHQINTSPSSIVLVGDGMVGSPLDWNELTNNSFNDRTRRFHVEKGRVNFLFVDGHAASAFKGETRSFQWFDSRSSTGPLGQQNLGWF